MSLFADMCYEGMRSISGPYLASLGASALVVGLITGAGEGLALVLRLVSGSLADKFQRHWTLTIFGYALTAICVPLLAVAPKVGGAGLAVAAVLILAERTGKAIRSPSKSVLLADFAAQTGRGKGFAVHKALDQIGAFSGPLVVAAAIALTSSMATGLAILAIPGVIAMVLLGWLRRNIGPQAAQSTSGADVDVTAALPPSFYRFAWAMAASTAGLMTFGVMSYHLVTADLVPNAVVPVMYAGAMAAAALGALGTGWVYDRVGRRVLFALPLLVCGVVALAFSPSLILVGLALLMWGLATGIGDSTVKAMVADLVPRHRLGTAYGIFAAFQGVAALLGGGLAGWLYTNHLTVLIATLVAAQIVSAVLLLSLERDKYLTA